MLDYSKGAPPLYNQVKKILKQKIVDGLYPVHKNIPSEKELEEEFGVSRITVRKALEELLNEGYIARQRGKGTVVLQRNIIEEEIHINKSFTEEMKEQGIVPGTRSTSLRTVIAGGAIAEALEVEAGEKVLELTRVRTGDNTPIVIFKTYINPKIVQITQEELNENESLYFLLYQKKKPVRMVKEVFEVSLSTEWNSQLLEIPLGSPLFKRTSVVHSDGRPLLYTESYYNGYLYRYYITY